MTLDNDEQWLNLMTPDVMRRRLISCSIYLAAFHLLRNSIVKRLREFFTDGFNDDGVITDSRYQTDVLSRSKSPVYASLDWLRENGAVEESDIKIFSSLRERRNIYSHTMHSVILNGVLLDDLPVLFNKLKTLLRKIEVWWVVNLEVPIMSDGKIAQDIDEEQIVPGSLIMIDLMMSIALGSDEEASSYLAAYLKSVIN